MGVFGQIYGSRIVVGLASPSQNQLGAIGKGLVSFNRRVHGSFSKNRIEAAKKYSIESTPTIVINEKKLEGSINFKNIKKKIEEII